MEKRELKVGEAVQIKPGVKWFGGCFMVVTEPKSFGAQGYVSVPGEDRFAFVRIKYEDIEPIGRTVWMRDKEK